MYIAEKDFDFLFPCCIRNPLAGIVDYSRDSILIAKMMGSTFAAIM